MIQITNEKATLADLNINDLYQKPYRAFQKYWHGSNESFELFVKKHNLDTNFEAYNIDMLHFEANSFLQDFKEVIEQDIGSFDFRLRSAMKPRNLKDLLVDDYVKTEFDISQETNKKEIEQYFLNADSRSFIDFRKIENDKLIFIYNQRGIFDEGERIAIVKSRNSITLKDNFKLAKENNFIISGMIAEIAKAKVDFSFSYEAGGAYKEIIAYSDEILGFAKKLEDKLEEKSQNAEIKQIAKEEIIKEQMQTRQSLAPDSNYVVATKEANTEARLDVKSNTNLDDIVEKSLSDYAKKEIEKVKLRLEKAENEAKIAYQEIRVKINNDGMSINEALNFVKQKYREDHTINLASVYLTKDILEIGQLQKQIQEQNETITKREEVIATKEEAITKREETISSLKSTLQTKINEFSLAEEKNQKAIEMLANEAEKTIEKIKQSFDVKIQDYEKEIAEQDNLITRLDEINKINEKTLSDYENIKMQLNDKNQKNAVLNEKLQSLVQENERILTEHENLKKQLNDKDEKITNLNEKIENTQKSSINNEKILAFLEKFDIMLEQKTDDKEQERKSSVRDILKGK